MSSSQDSQIFSFDSGALCLDFANTIPHRPQCTDDKLTGYRQLVAWGLQSGTLSQDEAGRLLHAGLRSPKVAARALRNALALREGVYRIFSAHAAGVDPPDGDIALLNRSFGEAMGHLRVGSDATGFHWRWSNDSETPGRIVWPVARSAGNLLVSEDLQWVRECASSTCSWLFLDTSRTRRRKWCDMSTCGNREKARRHYHRARAAAE
jgi:predicted RNA-binding Zn ribbon-like protein